MACIYVYALLTALLFGWSTAVETEKTVEDLLGMIQTLQSEMTALKFNDQKAQKEIATLKSDNQKMQEQFKAEIRQLQDDKTALMEEIHVMKGQMKNKQLDADSLFLATLSETVINIESQDVVVWDSAPINPGSNFNTETGGYTAPVNGYYQFTACKQGNNGQASFYFLVDEVRYAYKFLYAGESIVPASCATITVELTAGQIVTVQNEGSTQILGTQSNGIHSWFTGGLLYVP